MSRDLSCNPRDRRSSEKLNLAFAAMRSARCYQSSPPLQKRYSSDWAALHRVSGSLTRLQQANCFVQQSHNYEFESDTDTEVIAKLVKYLWDNRESDDIRFSTLVERVMQQMVGSSLCVQFQCYFYKI